LFSLGLVVLVVFFVFFRTFYFFYILYFRFLQSFLSAVLLVASSMGLHLSGNREINMIISVHRNVQLRDQRKPTERVGADVTPAAGRVNCVSPRRWSPTTRLLPR